MSVMGWDLDLAAGILLRLEKSGLTKDGLEQAFSDCVAAEVARHLDLLAQQGLVEATVERAGRADASAHSSLTFKGMMFVDQAQKAPWLADVRDKAPAKGMDLGLAAVRYSLEHLLLEQGKNGSIAQK